MSKPSQAIVIGTSLAKSSDGVVRTGVAVARATGAVLAALEQREVDLAILGTHGRSGFDRLVLGSVAAGVLHKAGCNLLLVPPGDVTAAGEPAAAGADWEYVSDETPALAGKGAAS